MKNIILAIYLSYFLANFDENSHKNIRRLMLIASYPGCVYNCRFQIFEQVMARKWVRTPMKVGPLVGPFGTPAALYSLETLHAFSTDKYLNENIFSL